MIWIRNNMQVNKWWQNLYFSMNYPFKLAHVGLERRDEVPYQISSSLVILLIEINHRIGNWVAANTVTRPRWRKDMIAFDRRRTTLFCFYRNWYWLLSIYDLSALLRHSSVFNEVRNSGFSVCQHPNTPVTYWQRVHLTSLRHPVQGQVAC